ncbi:MAG: HIRAN domain-containing protein [Chitinophagaceae bacterium]|nr:HIRAN domain-containing protein [Chitinophagaceae bacterium]
MNRSGFLKQLIASIAIGKLPVSITKDFRKIYLLQCFVAGFRHYEGMKLLDSMKEGDLLELVREPENQYDDCAIALHLQGRKIGFIPASVNEMLSYLLDADALSLFAVITHLEKNSQPWENVAIAVYFIQEVNKDLPAHASYLTRIEAPHYRTLNRDKKRTKEEKTLTIDNLFNDTNRVINLDAIPAEQTEAKAYFEKYYSRYPVTINKPGRFVHIKDDGIYSYLYEIADDIQLVKDTNGHDFLEFSLGVSG